MNILENSYVSFCNLDHRTDRLEHMNKELLRIGLHAIRQRSFPWKETDYKHAKYRMMYERSPGAIGCLLSQVQVMKKAYEIGLNAMVLEDDLIFATDIHERFDYISKWLEGKQWDIVFLGGTFHSPAYWHKFGESGMRPNVSANLGKDFDHTDDPRIKRVYGCFSTHAYIVNYSSIQKILGLIDKHVHESIGIDHLFLRVEPQLQCFCFVPGSVIQKNNLSDIGRNSDGSPAMTIFSGFSKLNGTEDNSAYWFKNLMTEFDPEKFKWL